MANKSIIVSIFFLSVFFASQELPGQAEEVDSRSDANKPPSNADMDNETVDHRENVLLNGIDSEVAVILTELEREKNERYNNLLKSILPETRNSSIAAGIYRLWEATSYETGLDLAKNELLKVVEDAEFELTTVQAAMSYLAELKYLESQDLLIEIANNRDSGIATTAIRALGHMGGITDTTKLKLLLDRLETEDPFAEEDLVAALIVTLGEIRYEPAAEELVMIADNASAPAIHRGFACISVGKIGRAEDYEVIESIYYEADNAILRSYALAGLAEFPKQDITAVLVQALKRDSFWRIRMIAAEKLAESDSPKVHELLRYKIANDPVKQVRIASIRALGKSSNRSDWNFLIEYFEDGKKSADIRLASLKTLIENRIPGTNKAIFSVMDKLWKEDKGRFLEFTCLELSKAEWAALAPVYERMLDNENWIIQVYGIRGIRRNSIASLTSKINNLDGEGIDERVLREVELGK